MAIIQSGASSDQLTIDPTSKAAHVTAFDSAGNEIDKPSVGSYLAQINVRQTAATALGNVVWAMRNPVGSTITAYIRHLNLTVAFDGTAAAATTVRYELERFSAATPTGGTALTIVKKRNSYGASGITDIRFLDTGLTTTGLVFEAPFVVVGTPISVSGTQHVEKLDFL